MFNKKIIEILKINIILWGDFILILIHQFVETEIEDEMAEHNNQKAMPNTLSVLYVCSLFSVMIAISLEECIVNLKLILPFLVGGMSLLRFGFFLFYEKVGD
ncbi:hypothetical protein [Clostridium botulinum]|uniref:Uncharacterized protein n=1 Tax=Clostridium botulinum TaxID=1491 RepID=A0A6G4HH27_CLOBO|nr:hypothetical protein [Clostridium botulinum]MBY6839818.1 hypothetical protein [Clostridium botulinum]NFH34722.1 hypothetical protein [Clostridium botulinum]NFU26809.1 hypothetical protein [Clostridium botulinum]NFV04732.1 hypothetical protein [Clostridium botulinum]